MGYNRIMGWLKNLWHRENSARGQIGEPETLSAPANPVAMVAATATVEPVKQPGLVRGKHYSQWMGEVQDRKRQGRYEDCLDLLLEIIAATEAEQTAEGNHR